MRHAGELRWPGLHPTADAHAVPSTGWPFCLLLAPHCLLPVPSSVALWGLSKKRPLALQREAHGLRGEPGLEQPFWVSSVAALLNTDLVATGEHRVAEEGPRGCLVRVLILALSLQAPTAPACGSGSAGRASGDLILSVTSLW